MICPACGHALEYHDPIDKGGCCQVKVGNLEKKVAQLEKALIAARLELSAARPCLMCGKTTSDGCKADVSPYVCDPAWKPYQS